MKVYWAPTICGQREVGPSATVSALSCAGSVGVCARPIPGSVATVPVVTSIANLSARRRAGRELAFFTVGQQQMQPSTVQSQHDEIVSINGYYTPLLYVLPSTQDCSVCRSTRERFFAIRWHHLRDTASRVIGLDMTYG